MYQYLYHYYYWCIPTSSRNTNNTTSRSRILHERVRGGRCGSSGGWGLSGRYEIWGFGGDGFDLCFFSSLIHSPLGNFSGPTSSIRISRSASAVYIRRYRSVRRSSSSSLVVVAAAVFSSSVEALANMEQYETWRKIWSFNDFSDQSETNLKKNLKQYEIWGLNLKFFVPIWNQSKTSLKPIWKIHQSEIFTDW